MTTNNERTGVTDRASDIWDQIADDEIEQFAQEARDRADIFRAMKLESPIEAMVLASAIRGTDAYRVFAPGKSDEAPVVIVGEQTNGWMEIHPQWKVGRYRVDFLISRWSGWLYPDISPGPIELARVVVECDGHEFHERTKEQAKRDRSRDRALQNQGLMVLRFTGAELHANTGACLMEVWRALDRLSAGTRRQLTDAAELARLRRRADR